MLDLDPNDPFHARVLAHLERDAIAWLVTVDADGTPQPSPIWFLWDGATALIYSQPGTAKLRNIERSPRVALHFDGDGRGGDIVVLTGTAGIDQDAPAPDAHPAYLAKYADGIARIGMDPARFAATYAAAVRMTPERLRGH